MKKWRLLKTIEARGAMQMAIDESMLLARAEGIIPNTLRFFTWSPPAVSIGFFQSMEQEVDLPGLKRMGFDAVRRYTGGGAVFHDRELTYSIAMAEEDAPEEIVESYEKICGGITIGLGHLGLDAEFKPINDVLCRGRKISGNAQTRKMGVLLQHGTILLDVNPGKMFSVLKVPDEKLRGKMIRAAEERVTSLNREAGRAVPISELEQCLKRGFGKTLSAEFEEAGLTAWEQEKSGRICEEKYSSDKWNFWR